VIFVALSFNGSRLAIGHQFSGGNVHYLFVYDFSEDSLQHVGADM